MIKLKLIKDKDKKIDILFYKKELIHKVLAQTFEGETFYNVLSDCLINDYDIWSDSIDTFSVSTIAICNKDIFSNKRFYNIYLAVGDLNILKNTQIDFEKRALELECSKLTLSGRKGWLKVLGPKWKAMYLTMHCDLY